MKPRTLAIVQARTGSSRLPGKVLADIEGQPMLVRVLERLERCQTLDRPIVVAVPHIFEYPANQEIFNAVNLDGAARVSWSSTAENDVLGRYVEIAKCYGAEIVVRITADCPLLDPALVDTVVGTLLANRDADYACNVCPRTYPRGLDAEAFWLDTLLRLDRYCTEPKHREHVTTLIREEYGSATECVAFSMLSVQGPHLHGDWCWTVDTQEDLDYVRELYRTFDLATTHLSYEELAQRITDGAKVPA